VSEPSDVVLAYWSEHRQQLRQSESQRAVLTNFLLVITAGLSGFIVQRDFAMSTLPLAVFIVLIGLYGALSAAKYHERAAYHLNQGRALTDTLQGMGALAEDTNVDEARTAHYRKYRILHRIRLHWLWTGLHLAVAGYGIAICVAILAR
jgi:hypothetical protein